MALMQVIWTVSTLVVLVESLELMQSSVVMSKLVRPLRALLRVELLSLWQVPKWLLWVDAF